MGKTRVCGAACHKAKGNKCRCWCGGVFHGSGGLDARKAFMVEFIVEIVPTTERAFQEITGQPDLFADMDAGNRWRGAIHAAVEAHMNPAPKRMAATR